MPSMSTEMKIRTVKAAKGRGPGARYVTGAWHASHVRFPLAVLLACALAACTAPATTVTRTTAVSTPRRPRSPNPTPAPRRTARVTRVVDGDTAHVRYHGRDVTIRF